ncbi:MAG: polysaccharide deacetylase family protein [Desulfobacterales bacterium]
MNCFLITVDVEDWFQVENLRPWAPAAVWDRLEPRVEANVNRLLDLFDSFKPFGSPASTPRARSPFSCTFFVLGWVARRLPRLVREIAARGHEVASHGSSHRMCGALSDAELREDLAGSKRLLEDITGSEVAGFRAPNFSVDDRVLALAREAGYRYDSSYNSFGLHGRYGRITLNGRPRAGIAYEIFENFFELPLSNICVDLPGLKPQASSRATKTATAGFVLPWSGGAYFRLMPFGVFRKGVRSILKRDGAYLFYVHPWEIDPGQPRLRQASAAARFKHYTNLTKTEGRLRKMIEGFGDCRFTTCRDYLNNLGSSLFQVGKSNFSYPANRYY